MAKAWRIKQAMATIKLSQDAATKQRCLLTQRVEVMPFWQANCQVQEARVSRLSGHFQITPGAGICQSLLGKNASRWLIGSNMGYGFICQYDSMISKNKAGKAQLTLPKGASVLPPLLCT